MNVLLIYSTFKVAVQPPYTDLFSHHYSYNVTEETHWQVRVQHNNVERGEPQYVRFPKEAVNGSFFGTCTCGADKTDAVPCEHIAAVALSSCLRPHITPISIMLTWWGREQWCKQFPSDLYCDGSMTMKSIKDGKIPDVTLCYCPDWTAPNKSGYPKKAERHKSGLEEAMAKAKGGKKPPKMKRWRCAICAKCNHKTENCFVLTRHKNDNEMTTIVTMGTMVNHVTGGGRMEDRGQEGAVPMGTTVNHVTRGGRMEDNGQEGAVPMGTMVNYVTGGGRMEDDGQEGVV
jgi:hypothetical protein